VIGKGFPGKQLILQGFGESLAGTAQIILDGLIILDLVGLPTVEWNLGFEEIVLGIEIAMPLFEVLSGIEVLEVPVSVSVVAEISVTSTSFDQVVHNFQEILPILELNIGQETVILEMVLPPVELYEGVAEVNFGFPARMVVNA
jgi:hypothetical protein